MGKRLCVGLLASLFAFLASASPKVAVLDVVAQKNIDPAAAAPITESIMEEVIATRAYVVLDRANVEQTLKEQEFDATMMVDDSHAAQAGQFLGADYIIAGKVLSLGESYFVVAKMIEVKTGIIVAEASEQGEGKPSALVGMARAVGKKLVAGARIGASQPAPGSGRIAPTPGQGRIKAGFVIPMSMSNEFHMIPMGIKRLQEKYKDWLDVDLAEKVDASSAAASFARLADTDGCGIIFAWDWGFADRTIEAAVKHPGIAFESASADLAHNREPNLGRTNFDDAWFNYLEGLVSGAVSRSGKVGFLSEDPKQGPWVLKNIDYFALGVRAANRKAEVLAAFLAPEHWNRRGEDGAATRELLAKGCDFIAGSTSREVWEALADSGLQGKRALGFQRDQSFKVKPGVIVSGPFDDASLLFEKPLLDYRNGAWKPGSYNPKDTALFGGGGEPFNPAFLAELRSKKLKTPDLGEVALLDLLERRRGQILSGEFEPFTGPIKDQRGKARLPDGVRADDEYIGTLDWIPDNVTGSPR
jgi:basic membrane lipoprotein Med (substrate-binding protein (PBP1-ABC) superfamily)